MRNRADGREFAVKVSKRLFRTRNERRLLLREVENSRLLGEHAHIVRYYRAWQDQRSLYLQLELCERGTLRSHVGALGCGVGDEDQPPAARVAMSGSAALFVDGGDGCASALDAAAAADGAGAAGGARRGGGAALSEREVWAYTAQLASGLAHIHAHGLLHLDMKPENILVTREGHLKIGDLGLCVSAGEWEEQARAAASAASRARARGLQSAPAFLCVRAPPASHPKPAPASLAPRRRARAGGRRGVHRARAAPGAPVYPLRRLLPRACAL